MVIFVWFNKAICFADFLKTNTKLLKAAIKFDRSYICQKRSESVTCRFVTLHSCFFLRCYNFCYFVISSVDASMCDSKVKCIVLVYVINNVVYFWVDIVTGN